MLTLKPGVNAVTSTEMKSLIDSILPTSGATPYYNSMRPLTNQDSAVEVKADLYMIGINDFDDAEQKLTTTAYLHVTWRDEIIMAAWSNAAVEQVYVPQTNVWLPDLALQNGFESLKGLGSSFMYVNVLKNGTVTWKPYQVYESACTVDVLYFPFDKTTCSLRFVIWSNTIDLVKISTGSVGLNMEFFQESSQWSVVSTSAANYETSTTSGVTFSLHLKRKPLFYLLNILIPVVMLAVLNIFVFVLPASSGEKSGFSVTAFLAFVVFLTIISSELPQNSERLSLFDGYLFLMTLLSTVIVVVTMIQLRLYNRDEDQPIPNALHSLVGCVRKIRCKICIGKGHVAFDEEQRRKKEAEVTWSSVCSSLDFIFFWMFLILMLLLTILCVTIIAIASR